MTPDTFGQRPYHTVLLTTRCNYDAAADTAHWEVVRFNTKTLAVTILERCSDPRIALERCHALEMLG